jgi:membrane protein DedA with SNARE-associated domain
MNPMLPALIAKYGHLAILAGTFFEGETILVLGGLAAYRGYLLLAGVILAAFCGSLCGDQLFFFIGRRHSRFLLSRRPSWQPKVDRVNRLLEKFRTPLILSFRFLYGLRTVTPFVIGMSSDSTLKFVLLNAVGAALWALTFSWGGYLFGQALEATMKNVRYYEVWILAEIAAVGLSFWTVRYALDRRRFHKSNGDRQAAWNGPTLHPQDDADRPPKH